MQSGQVLAGKYRIERVLGQGGMGMVVVATHVGFDDRVAIKCLLPDVASNGELVARFLREGRATRKIQSEHVVRVSDVGTLDSGAPYMVMEYLDGCDLSELVRQRGALPLDEALEYVLQACEAISEAHALGIVHRDLKPANLFLTRRRDGSPCVKVLDFGISKCGPGDGVSAALTRTMGMMGSPLYMSPEQLQSARDVDARTDIWAIGVVLYELLAGVQPFLGETLPQLSIAIMMSPVTPLTSVRANVPPGLESVIERCLMKNRDERFGNLGAFAAALAPFSPAVARTSIERITRVCGLTPKSPSFVESSGPRDSKEVPASTSGAQLDTTTSPSIRGAELPLRVTAKATRSRLPLLLVAAALLVVAALVVLTVSRKESRGVRAATTPATKTELIEASSQASVTEVTSNPPPPPTHATDLSNLAAARVSAQPSTGVMRPSPKPTSVKDQTTKPLPTKAPPVTAPPVPNCNPPFAFDARGNKVFKPECL